MKTLRSALPRWIKASALALSVCTAAAVTAGAGCAEEPEEVCGFDADAPKTKDGKGSATRSDDEDFTDVAATWSPGANGAVIMGVLSLTIPKDETGADTEQLIADGAFPICIPLGQRGEKSGSANYVDDGYVSDAEHTGMVALYEEDGGILRGRFEAAMYSEAVDKELSFTDGVFAAEQSE